MGLNTLLASSFLAGLIVGPSALANEAMLKQGQAVVGAMSQECDGSFLFDTVGELCDLFGSGVCTLNSTCRTFQRQIPTGTVLGPVVTGRPWNGRGGSGELMADALMCSMRELSPQLGGPLKSGISINVGLGTVEFRQEVGFKDWTRLNPVFNGYRKIILDLPVLGRFDAVTQNITMTKRQYAFAGPPRPKAGNQEIYGGFNINVATEEKTKDVTITPPGFPVMTPLGEFVVNPVFKYLTRTAVVNAPYTSSYTDLANFLGRPETVRLYDVYGFDSALSEASQLVHWGNHGIMRRGFISQLGLGSRGQTTGAPFWIPPTTGVVERPDFDLRMPRSAIEAQPSVYVSAAGEVKYPESPFELLPDWIDDVPYLKPPTAYITVAPTLEAGAGGQFNVLSGEGTNHYVVGENKFASSRLASSAMTAGLNGTAGFKIDVGMRLKVVLGLPIPVGDVVLVDINPKFPIPLVSDTAAGNFDAVFTTSTGNDKPESLDALKTFYGNYPSGAAAKDFIKQCYAPDWQPGVSDVPKEPVKPGDPKKLWEDGGLFPCNICIATKEAHYDGSDPEHPTPLHLPEWMGVIQQSAQPANWTCNASWKNGCMDMCRLNSETGKLIVVKTVGNLAEGMPGGQLKAQYQRCQRD